MKSVFSIMLFWPLVLLSQTDFERAEKLYTQKQFSAAKILFENDLRQYPQHLKSVEYLGDIQAQLGHWETAAGYYKQLKTRQPFQADYHYKFGGAMAMMAKDCNRLRGLTMVDDIETSFEKAIKYNPKHIEARWALIELYLQLPGIFGGSEKRANRYANELAQLSPVDGWLSKGRIAEYFQRYAAAEKFYQKAIETGNSKTTYQKLADLYQNKMHQPEKAKAVWANYNKTRS